MHNNSLAVESGSREEWKPEGVEARQEMKARLGNRLFWMELFCTLPRLGSARLIKRLLLLYLVAKAK